MSAIVAAHDRALKLAEAEAPCSAAVTVASYLEAMRKEGFTLQQFRNNEVTATLAATAKLDEAGPKKEMKV